MSPVPVNEYPRTWSEFLDWFSSEEACLAYLEQLRWPLGFVCPECAVMATPSRASRGRLLCKNCGHQSTVTAGTIFDKTRTPLKVWLAAAWYVTNQKQGVSALGLQRVLGLGSYQTAWTMLHRFRRAMVRPDRERLKGVVEVDETYLAIAYRKQTAAAARGKGKSHKVPIVVAVEMLEPKGFGRIRLRRIAKGVHRARRSLRAGQYRTRCQSSNRWLGDLPFTAGAGIRPRTRGPARLGCCFWAHGLCHAFG